eukprot:TRINITY_DN26705_c0_g1_i1.p1 TRINITY_DN26705_c0_g1~~TRINITY_DN26705_c0_g1_i1.p1  ORF type:complete len:147 (+),score=9.62 TRINITY_DN26705_c0_g1_i1:44-484(+)
MMAQHGGMEPPDLGDVWKQSGSRYIGGSFCLDKMSVFRLKDLCAEMALCVEGDRGECLGRLRGIYGNWNDRRQDSVTDVSSPRDCDSYLTHCSICLTPMTQQDVSRTLGCHHVFHASCIDPHFSIGGMPPPCPDCGYHIYPSHEPD